MEIELKTNSLKEILQKCKSNNINIDNVKINVKIFEDIRKPGEPITKLYLKYKKGT